MILFEEKRPRKQTWKSYAFLEVIDSEDGEDSDVDLVPCTDSHNDMLREEIYNAGVPEHWLEDLRKLPSGYYEFEYTTDTETESDGDGHTMFEYLVIDGLVAARRSFKSRLIFYKTFKVNPIVRGFLSVFMKVWRVEYLYGGVGTSSQNMYLPNAIWYRFTKPHPWGKCPDISIRRSGY